MNKENSKNNMRSSEPILSRYMHQKGARLGLPVSGAFELTPRCNFNCKMCYVHMDNRQILQSGKKELVTDEWLQIASDARDEGMLFLLLTGGEPFIRGDFEKLYIEMKKMGLMISINSNGSMLDDYWLDFMRKNPPTRLNITLYGGSDETYERMCGRPIFHKVVENICKLKNAGISVRLNASITPENKEDIEKIYNISKEIGVHVKATTYMFPPIRVDEKAIGNSPLRFSAKDAAKYMLLCQEQYMTPEQLHDYAQRPLCEELDDIEEGSQMKCRAGRSTFWINWDGRMTPCGMMNVEGYSVKELGFKECWNRVRQDVDAIRLPVECSACKDRKNCHVCAASCYAETGGYQKTPEYICCMTREMRRLAREKYDK